MDSRLLGSFLSSQTSHLFLHQLPEGQKEIALGCLRKSRRKYGRRVRQYCYQSLPGDILVRILTFVGPGHFAFVAPTCKQFREAYGIMMKQTDFDAGQWMKHPGIPGLANSVVTRCDWLTATTLQSVVESLPRSGIYLSAKWDPGCIIRNAARYGNLSLLEILHDRKFFARHVDAMHCWVDACEFAAIGGQLNVLKWLTENNTPRSYSTCSAAAKCGNLEILRYANENGFPWTESTCALAARGGHLDVLRYARVHQCPWGSGTCSCAARFGHLEVLQWSRANGCPWNCRTCAGAALGGHLEVLQWARDNGCSWDEATCAGAAHNGHLAVLQWARANGCPWNRDTCRDAAMNGHLEVLQWARANGCPWSPATCFMAARHGHLKVLQWAWRHGCPWHPRVCALAFAHGHSEILWWARGLGAPCRNPGHTNSLEVVRMDRVLLRIAARRPRTVLRPAVSATV